MLLRRKPNPYVSKETLRSSFHGKQFGTAFPKDGKTNDAFFEKKFSWVSEVRYRPSLCARMAAPNRPAAVPLLGHLHHTSRDTRGDKQPIAAGRAVL